jgi:hypothetical protein
LVSYIFLRDSAEDELRLDTLNQAVGRSRGRYKYREYELLSEIFTEIEDLLKNNYYTVDNELLHCYFQLFLEQCEKKIV